MIVKRRETVEYIGHLERAEVIARLSENPDGTEDPVKAATYAAMPDDQLNAEFLRVLQQFGPTSDALSESIERHNTVVADDWELC